MNTDTYISDLCNINNPEHPPPPPACFLGYKQYVDLCLVFLDMRVVIITSIFAHKEAFLGQLTFIAVVKICPIKRSLNDQHSPVRSWKAGKIEFVGNSDGQCCPFHPS